MPIEAVCPSCAYRHQAPSELAGKRFRCKRCRAAVTIPLLTENSPSAPDSSEIPSRSDPSAPAARRNQMPRLAKLSLIAGAVYVGLLVTGWFWPALGATVMLAGAFAGIGIALTGVVLFFLGLEGRHRFTMVLKIALRFVGFKLITFDASLWNPQTKRAAVWLFSGIGILVAFIFPADYFRSLANPPAAVADGGVPQAEEASVRDERSRDQREHAALVPSAFGPGPQLFPPPYAPVPGAPPYGPPPGFPQPPPVFFFYESLKYSPEETARRLDDELRRLPIYTPDSARVSQREQKIYIATSHLPDARFMPAIISALDAAGVTRSQRR